MPSAAGAGPEDVGAAAMVGPYRLVRLLGSGSMGRVYLARETHPAREVALKVVRGASPGLGERLRREIDVLAALEHPGIARLYAAGEARVEGIDTPWLAMEYVDGMDLLEFARARNASLAERLRLLIEIARAVQFAHEHGVIHRDLKPGNILVDRSGRPKILDFGIARRADEPGVTLTLAGQVLGTLPYVSPEQLGHGERGASVRGDVYALGVTAYELIGGALPYPRLGTASLLEALEILHHETPVPLASVAGAARGDLHTVVMKALAGDPARRYASAGAFADELQRVLEHRPVRARPPTAAYRARRFMQRHRALSAAAAIVFTALLVATVVSLRFALGERAARAQAEQHAREAAAVNAFLQRMLGSANPETTGGQAPALADVVATAERELDELASQPAVQRAVATTLASTRRALGDYPGALALSDLALALAERATPSQRRDLLRERASILIELTRFDEARDVLAEARAAWPAAGLAADLDLDLELARADSDEGKVDMAEDGLRTLIAHGSGFDAQTLAADRRLQTTLATARSSLSTLLREAGRLDEAEQLTREVLAWRLATFGERAPTTLTSRHNLALVLYARGDLAAAQAELRGVLALRREVLGDDHAATLTSWQTLANILAEDKQYAQAAEAARTSMEGFERMAGEAHVQTLAAMNSLAYILEQQGRSGEAEALYRRIIAIQQRAGSGHPSAFAPRNNLAMLLMDAGELTAAEAEFASLVADATRAVGPGHLMTAIFTSNQGLCLTRLDKLVEARTTLESAHARLLALVGPAHARTRTAAERLADVYARLGDAAGAAALRTAIPQA